MYLHCDAGVLRKTYSLTSLAKSDNYGIMVNKKHRRVYNLAQCADSKLQLN